MIPANCTARELVVRFNGGACESVNSERHFLVNESVLVAHANLDVISRFGMGNPRGTCRFPLAAAPQDGRVFSITITWQSLEMDVHCACRADSERSPGARCHNHGTVGTGGRRLSWTTIIPPRQSTRCRNLLRHSVMSMPHTITSPHRRARLRSIAAMPFTQRMQWRWTTSSARACLRSCRGQRHRPMIRSSVTPPTAGRRRQKSQTMDLKPGWCLLATLYSGRCHQAPRARPLLVFGALDCHLGACSAKSMRDHHSWARRVEEPP